MTSELRPGSGDSPADELAAADAAWAVLQRVLSGITSDDWSKPTPCSEFDVARLTDHLLHSIAVLGGPAGAELPEPSPTDSPEHRVGPAARAALDAWRRHGLDGVVSVGPAEMPARTLVGILALEFLVHAWDYATATGRTLDGVESLATYVLGLARTIITPEGRVRAGFDEPVDVGAPASALQQLIAFTGRS